MWKINTRIRARRRYIVLLVFTLLPGLHVHAADNKTVYVWSVVPQFTNTAIHRDWTPILNYLHKHTPYQFKLQLYKSIPDFEQGFLSGEPDIAYMNPYHAVMAKRAHNYQPILRDSERLLTGILVTRKDSNINSLADLSGKTISFPSPNAFAAALYMRALLREKEHINFTARYDKTHSNAYRQVLRRKAAAAGGVYRTLHKERKSVKENLKVVYTTPSTPSHPLTAHARVPRQVVKSIQDAFAAIQNDRQWQTTLKAILLPRPINSNYADYQFLEDLRLEKYIIKP